MNVKLRLRPRAFLCLLRVLLRASAWQCVLRYHGLCFSHQDPLPCPLNRAHPDSALATPPRKTPPMLTPSNPQAR